MTKIELETLGENRHMFSAAVHIDRTIYVTGGRTSDGDESSVFRYELAANLWKACPDMKLKKRLHGSCVLGETLYVYGGLENRNYLNYFEFLKLSKSNEIWHNFFLHSLKKSKMPAMCALDDQHIIVMGGNYLKPLSRAFALIPHTKQGQELYEGRTAEERKNQLKFECQAQTV